MNRTFSDSISARSSLDPVQGRKHLVASGSGPPSQEPSPRNMQDSKAGFSANQQEQARIASQRPLCLLEVDPHRQHTDDVLREMGLSVESIAELRRDEVIS